MSITSKYLRKNNRSLIVIGARMWFDNNFLYVLDLKKGRHIMSNLLFSFLDYDETHFFFNGPTTKVRFIYIYFFFLLFSFIKKMVFISGTTKFFFVVYPLI